MKIEHNASQVLRELTIQLKKDRDDSSSAMTKGMKILAEGCKKDIRENIVQAGLGKKLSLTWRSQHYPKNKNSFSPAAFLYNKAPYIVETYETGVTATAKNSKYFAIPTKAAMRRVGRKRITPALWESSGLPPLVFLPRKNGGVLAIRGFVSKSGKSFRNSKSFSRGQEKWLVIFVLVKIVRHKKKLKSKAIAFEWFNSYTTIVGRLLQ